MAVDSGQGPGRPGQGRRGEGPAGRGGGRGDRGGPGGRGGRDRGDRKGGSGGAGGRVVPELSALEKALAKVDFASEIQPLDAVVKVLRQARARSLQDLDMDTRGRLITTLSRVARQTRPAPDPETPAAPEADAGPAAVPGGDEQAASPSAPSEPIAESPGTGEGSPPPEAEAAEAAPGGDSLASPPEQAPDSPGSGEAGPPPEVEAAAAPSGSGASMTPGRAYTEVLFRVGLAWAAVGEHERADTAFAAAGRRPSQSELRAAESAGTAPDAAAEARWTGPQGWT